VKRARPFWGVILPAVALLLGGAGWIAYQFFMPPLRAANAVFLVEPYLQLGAKGDVHQPDLQFASPNTARWKVEVQLEPGHWSAAGGPSNKEVALANLLPFRLVRFSLPSLPEHQPITYRVMRDGAPVYQATIKAIKSGDDAWRVDIAGDIGEGDNAESQVARGMYDGKPDLLVIPGDIVYGWGRTSEYLSRLFPYYNADRESGSGVPLLRSTLAAACPGNHDTGFGGRGHYCGDLNLFPDGLGYFLWWDQPLNGPQLSPSGPDVPQPQGSDARRQAFLAAVGSEFPRETNFSFDYANAHWTVLDANDYVNWMHGNLRQWLVNDLDQAKTTWKFVVFHQPPFSSDTTHFEDQQMRQVADILQEHGVDVVFSGHVHGYQVTYPLKFKIRPQPGGALRSPDGVVDGDFELDKAFDGVKQTHPRGVIYITTGGGGAELYGRQVSQHKEQWQPFTRTFFSRHSFTQCDIKGNHLKLTQIAVDGSVLDEFAIDK
jgi:3',5'-cyclic AMP phosphodiesterase CpdA